MQVSHRRQALAVALILSAALILSNCTTVPHVVQIPQLPPLPPPAECLKASFESFAPELAGLPPTFKQLGKDDQARTLLLLKSQDTETYQTLRAQAIRCAR